MPIKTHLLILFLISVFFSPIEAQDDPIVAKVGNRDIPLSYIYQKIEELPLGDQIDVRDRIEHFIESVIQEEAMFQFMLITQFQEELELREEIKIIVVEHLVNKYIKSQINVAEEEVRLYYYANREQMRSEHVRARHIQLKDLSKCEKIKALIHSEASFADMARQHSLDRETGQKGGDMGYFMQHANLLGFEPKLFGLPLQTLHTFETPTACHLVWITEHIKLPIPPFEAVKAQIQNFLEREQEVRLLRNFLNKISQLVSIERLSNP